MIPSSKQYEYIQWKLRGNPPSAWHIFKGPSIPRLLCGKRPPGGAKFKTTKRIPNPHDWCMQCFGHFMEE